MSAYETFLQEVNGKDVSVIGMGVSIHILTLKPKNPPGGGSGVR